jgi:hypothetical protein
MSELQTNTKPTLEPMLQGRFPSPRDVDRRTLAAWATMFTMIWERADPITAATTEGQRRDFMATRCPLENWAIWMGTFQGRVGRETVFHRGLTVRKPYETDTQSNIQFTLIGVGTCFFLTFSTVEARDFSRFYPKVAQSLLRYQLLLLHPAPSALLPEPTYVGGISIQMYAEVCERITEPLLVSD